MIKLHWVTLNKTGAFIYGLISLGLVAELVCFNNGPLGCVCMYSLGLIHKKINCHNVLTILFENIKVGKLVLECSSFIALHIL